MEFIGSAVVAEILGVGQGHVGWLLNHHDDFPRPVADVSGARVWQRADIIDWHESHPPSRGGRGRPRRGQQQAT